MNTSFKDIADSIFLGMQGVIREMEEKGLINEHTTFEEIANYAGQHILITEEKDESVKWKK